MTHSKNPSESSDSNYVYEEEDVSLDAMECAKIDVDEVWYYLGKFGKYQLFQSLLLILAGIGLTPAVIGGMFTGKEVNFKCARNSTLTQQANSTSHLSECRVKVFGNDSNHRVADESCQEFDYEYGNRHISYISEWDLVCNKETVGHLAQILTMVGMGVGAFFLPSLGDRFGRKKLLIASELTVMVVMASMAFVSSFEVFVFLKFLSGAANQGQCVSAATLHMELYPIEQRSAVGFIYIVIWVTSYSLQVSIAWFLQDHSWRTIQLVFACFSTAVFLQIWFQDESLRWLMGNGQVNRARRVMMRACKLNRKSFPKLISSVLAPTKTNQNYEPNDGDDEKTLEEPERLPTVERKGTQRKTRTSPLDLIRTPGVRKITMIMAYTWCINSLTYYGLTLMTSSLFGDAYLNNLIAALLELLSGILMFYAVYKFGRKRTLIAFILLAGLCLFLTVLVYNLTPSTKGYFILQTALTQLGKCFISGSFNTIWCYTPELFPTNIRNMGVGVNSSSARLGATFSPLFNLLAKKAPWAPGTIFSVSCFLCAFLLMILPETRWRELPTTIEEVEGWFKEDKLAKTLKRNKKTQPEDEEQELNKVSQNGHDDN